MMLRLNLYTFRSIFAYTPLSKYSQLFTELVFTILYCRKFTLRLPIYSIAAESSQRACNMNNSESDEKPWCVSILESTNTVFNDVYVSSKSKYSQLADWQTPKNSTKFLCDIRRRTDPISFKNWLCTFGSMSSVKKKKILFW